MKMLLQFRKAGAHEHLVHVQDENLSQSRHGSVMHITLLLLKPLQHNCRALLSREIKTNKEMVPG